MSNMAASYPYSMLGYSYPPGAYLQLPGYGLPAATHQQLGALLGPQGLAGLGAQNWAAAGASPAHLMAAQQAAYATSKQGYPVIAPMGGGAVSAAGSPPKLSFGGGGVASMPAAIAPGGGCGRAVAPTTAEPAEARSEAAGGEGEEYLQELIKERDSIESNSTSSLSKTHILRLLNKG